MESYSYYEKTPYDDMLTDWMNRYKDLVKPDRYESLYTGTKEEIYDIYYTFLLRFGYNCDIRLTPLLYKDGTDTYGISFEPNPDPDSSLAAFSDEFERTKVMADQVKGDSMQSTVDNAFTYLKNVTPYRDYDSNDNEDLRKHSYGGFSGVPQLCEGKGTMFTRLCYMNGIKCENAMGFYNNGGHWWNLITTENGERWYDAALHMTGTTLPSEYTLTSWAEVGK